MTLINLCINLQGGDVCYGIAISQHASPAPRLRGCDDRRRGRHDGERIAELDKVKEVLSACPVRPIPPATGGADRCGRDMPDR